MLCGLFSSCGKAEATLVAVPGLLTEVASLVVEHGLSRCGSWALEHRLDSCGTRAKLPPNMWDLTGSGIELMSPALAGGFFTTEPPGKPHVHVFK